MVSLFGCGTNNLQANNKTQTSLNSNNTLNPPLNTNQANTTDPQKFIEESLKKNNCNNIKISIIKKDQNYVYAYITANSSNIDEQHNSGIIFEYARLGWDNYLKTWYFDKNIPSLAPMNTLINNKKITDISMLNQLKTGISDFLTIKNIQDYSIIGQFVSDKLFDSTSSFPSAYVFFNYDSKGNKKYAYLKLSYVSRKWIVDDFLPDYETNQTVEPVLGNQ